MTKDTRNTSQKGDPSYDVPVVKAEFKFTHDDKAVKTAVGRVFAHDDRINGRITRDYLLLQQRRHQFLELLDGSLRVNRFPEFYINQILLFFDALLDQEVDISLMYRYFPYLSNPEKGLLLKNFPLTQEQKESGYFAIQHRATVFDFNHETEEKRMQEEYEIFGRPENPINNPRKNQSDLPRTV